MTIALPAVKKNGTCHIEVGRNNEEGMTRSLSVLYAVIIESEYRNYKIQIFNTFPVSYSFTKQHDKQCCL